MQVWKRFGDFIGRHYAAISPVLVVLAVAFPDVFSPMKAIVPPMFAVITFQGALGNDFGSLFDAFRRPRAMLAILGIVTVAMPVLAFGTARLVFGTSPDLVAGIVLEYSVPVAVVSTMWIDMHDGDSSLGLATLLVSTVLSPMTIPLTLKLLLGTTVEVDALDMVWSMTVQIAIPALAGTAVNHFGHGWGKRELSPALAPATKVMLILVILANSTAAAPYMRNLSLLHLGVVVFIGMFSAIGFLVGFALARISHQGRARAATMTFQSGLRNISAGAVVAARYLPGESMLPVIAGTLFQQILAAFAGKLIDRVWRSARD